MNLSLALKLPTIPPMRIQALATDGDGTCLEDNKMLDETAAALQQLRSAGIALILVTGEHPNELKEFPHLELFDHVIAENGAVIVDQKTGAEELLGPRPPAELLVALNNAGITMQVGRVLIATETDARRAVQRVIDQLGVDWHTVPNRKDLMVLPASVDKATGLDTLLKRIQIAPQQVAAIGDAENDCAMLKYCGLAVAVGNGLPPVKECAKLITRGHAGHGVIELVHRLLNEKF
jgi:hydroxymethylpyrimidine pyrophosphatase-like HAD family hydrolase